jgi:hypothetical protein
MVAPLTPQANPLRAQSAWNLSAPSGGALKLGSGVLPKTYARPGLDVRWLGELVDLISGIGLGAAEHREKDILGRVYEYFLGRFHFRRGQGRRVLHATFGREAARRDDRAVLRPNALTRWAIPVRPPGARGTPALPTPSSSTSTRISPGSSRSRTAALAPGPACFIVFVRAS